MVTTSSQRAKPVEAGRPFLDWLAGWQANLPTLDLRAYLDERGIAAEDVAVVSADLVVGFCYRGTLASPRIANIVEPAAALMQRAHELGVRQFAIVQEYHTHDAPEFQQFGPHCIRGTEEAEMVPALKDLPFSDTFTVLHKNSLHPAIETGMDEWLDARSNVNTFIVVGDCTDLCTYQFMMYLKLRANAANRNANVIVPTNCVQTYDLPVDVAQQIGAMPHDGDLMHSIFLYHMALNGATVVSAVR